MGNEFGTLVFGFLLLSPADGNSDASGELAVLEVWGDRPLVVETLKENVKIHSNREYRFVQIPEFFRGLPFTVHEHNNPSKNLRRKTRKGKEC